VGGGELLMPIEPWYLGPVPTCRVNKHKDRKNIRQQTADHRQTVSVNRKHKTKISKQKKRRSVSRRYCLCLSLVNLGGAGGSGLVYTWT
jgi:hypothetical protein